MNVLELFAGIGGLSLGLERAGLRVVGHVERDTFCRAILHKHWPEVPCHDEAQTAPAWWRDQPRPHVHVVAGGPPCQGHSNAGRQLGTGDPRWGWPWYRDVLDTLIDTQTEAPLAVIENSPNLVRTGLEFILRDLADRGFDAWWTRIPAAALGAPTLRWRLILIAARRGSRFTWPDRGTRITTAGWDTSPWSVADPAGQGLPVGQVRRPGPDLRAQGDPDAVGVRSPAALGHRNWGPEPDLVRVAPGVPDRVDRVHSLGNAVVPAVGEYVGRLLIDGSRCSHDAA